MRYYTRFDRVMSWVDQLSKSTHTPRRVARPSPASPLPPVQLNAQEQKHAAGLMRVNHAGEVSAQALYRGQAWVARKKEVKQALRESGDEEFDHLIWCRDRVHQLGSHTSYLYPIWYGGAFFLGIVMGLLGDRYSLGFLVETERQVEEHLTDHLNLLPSSDHHSRAILEQMRNEEVEHREMAQKMGAKELPFLFKYLMKGLSQVMLYTAYKI